MRILCLLIPHLPVNLERRDSPDLVGRALIIDWDGRVWDCSPEALEQGVRVGMKIEGAQRLNSEAIVLAADIARYEMAFDGVVGMMARTSPVVEAGDRSEVYADISGQASGFDDESLLCQEIARKLEWEMGLKGMMGIAGDKFTSYVAAHTIGWGKGLLLRPNTEREFLARLPMDHLPLTSLVKEELRLLGIHSTGQFAQLPVGAVLSRLGPQGRQAHQLAQGRDRRPLVPYRPPKWAEATRQFEPPLEMNGMLARAVGELAHSCCGWLRDRSCSCQALRLILSFEDGRSHGARRTLSGPTADPIVVETSAREMVCQLSRVDRITEAHLALGELQAQRGKQLRLEAINKPIQMDLAQLAHPLATRFGTDRFCWGRVTDSSSPLSQLRFTWESWGGDE